MYTQIKKIFHYYLPEIKKYKWYLIFAAVFFSVYIGINDSFIPIAIKHIIDAIQGRDFSFAQNQLVLLGILYAMTHIFVLIALRLIAFAETRIAKNLHDMSYRHFMKHSYHFYANNFTGALTNKMERLGKNIVDFIDTFFFSFLSLVVSLTTALIVLARESISFTFITLTFLVFYILATLFVNKKIAPIYEARSRAYSQFTAYLADVFTNIQTILSFGAKSFEKKNFERENQNFFEKTDDAYKKQTYAYEALSVIPTIFLLVLIGYAIYLAREGIISIGSIVLVFMLSRNIVFKVWKIGNIAKRFTKLVSDTVEAIEIIEQEVGVKNPDGAEEVHIQKGDVRFEHVSFRYPHGEQVFTDFSLHIPAGQSVGIVGNSGSGKTTLVKLLLRLYDVQEGRITIDGQDIRTITQEALRHRIAYIPQETILFHRSIADNIRYGLEEVSSEKVQEVAKQSYVDEFVQDMEKGYETEVGERGVKLSGGQRQRIGIARAMLREDAPLLILDEATSSLDSLSEQYIQKSFEKLAENRTTIVIAHRLSTIQKMDRIIVMDKGEIIEDGTHEELLAKNGKYAELWNSQVGGFIQDA